MRTPVLATLALAAIALACDGSTDDALAGPTVPCDATTATPVGDVAVTAMQFIPSCARAAPGAAVTFRNLDWEAHWVTADDGQPEPFDSGMLYPGQTYTRTFATSGAVIRVHCRLHPSASGRILVAP